MFTCIYIYTYIYRHIYEYDLRSRARGRWWARWWRACAWSHAGHVTTAADVRLQSLCLWVYKSRVCVCGPGLITLCVLALTVACARQVGKMMACARSLCVLFAPNSPCAFSRSSAQTRNPETETRNPKLWTLVKNIDLAACSKKGGGQDHGAPPNYATH